MGWFTDTANAPLVYLNKDVQVEAMEVITNTGLTHFERTTTIIEKEWRGLTRAAADSIAAAKASDTGVITSKSERMNDANGYKVFLATATGTAWATTTTTTGA